MVPKDKDVRTMLASLEIRMEPDFSATREVVMNEPNGDKTRILFRREKRGVKLLAPRSVSSAMSKVPPSRSVARCWPIGLPARRIRSPRE